MTPPLFLAAEVPEGGSFELGGAEGRHAARVRRIAVGEVLDVGDGRGAVARCRVTAISGDVVRLAVTDRRVVPAPDPSITVVQALAKGDRSELAVELLTEVGADAIVPWAARRSVVQWSGERGARALERWRSTAREAAKQSRRPWTPMVGDPVTDLVPIIRDAAAAYVLLEAAAVPLAARALPTTGRIVLVVGPEGGITDAELDRLVAAGAVPVRLGPEVLRTSTAGAAAVSALSVRLGRWR